MCDVVDLGAAAEDAEADGKFLDLDKFLKTLNGDLTTEDF